jgi:hypothetical protein
VDLVAAREMDLLTDVVSESCIKKQRDASIPVGICSCGS